MNTNTNTQMPNNAQLQQTIQNTRAALDDAKLDAQLNSKGQVLVEDAKQLMDSTSRLIAEKNQDERMQRLVGNSIYAARDTRTGISGTNMPVGKEDLQGMRGEAREAYYASKDLVMMCIRSRQFRDIIMELIELIQTMLRTTQDKIGQNNQLNPTQLASQMTNQNMIPENQKQHIYDKFRDLLVQLSSRPEYSTTIDHLFTVCDHIASSGGQLRSSASDIAQSSAVPTDRYQDIFQDATIILEQFSGQGTVTELNQKGQNLFTALRQDEQVRAYFTEVRIFVRDVLKTPAMLQDQQKTDYGKGLVDRGRTILTGKYRPYFSDVMDCTKTILVNIRNDSVTQDFSTKLQKFVSDFAFDEEGRPDLFVIQNSFNQMKNFLVPMISRAMTNLPVPRIQGSNAKYDFAIDGLLLSAGDLLPDFVDIRTKTDNRMNVQHLSNDKRTTKIIMKVEKIRASFRGVHFWYRRKHMPRLEDEGVADVDLSQGNGVSIKIVWKLSSVNGQPYQLRLSRVMCNISKLRITIKNSRHNILDKLVTKLFAGMIKKQIATSVVNNIQKYIEPMNTRLNTLFRTKPAHGIAERVNNQMKGALFTGQSDQRSFIDRAKGTVQQGVQQIKQKRQQRRRQPTMGDMNGNGIPDYLERGYGSTSRGPTFNGPYQGQFYHTPEWERDFQWYRPGDQFNGYGRMTPSYGSGMPSSYGSGMTPSYGSGMPSSSYGSGITPSSYGVGNYMDSPSNRNRNSDWYEGGNQYTGLDRTPSSPFNRNRGTTYSGTPSFNGPSFGSGASNGQDYDLWEDDDILDDLNLDDDEDDDDLTTNDHYHNKWNNTQWNSNRVPTRSTSGRMDTNNDDNVGHDWTRGVDTGYNRYTSL